MNRDELAKELNLLPWDIDDLLLRGCPAKKFQAGWQFDLQEVKIWLEEQKGRIKRTKLQPPSSKPTFDRRWFKERCPICIDKGFPREKAGRVYTLGEVSGGEFHLRRTGIPCGHSAYLSCTQIFKSSLAGSNSKREVQEIRSFGYGHKH